MSIQFTTAERIILINQYEILAALKPDQAEEYDRVRELLEGGYELAYPWYFAMVSESTVDAEVCKRVLKIMTMFQMIQFAYERLPDDQKAHVDQRAMLFPGFDGNNEVDELAFANFVVVEEGKYASLLLAGNNDDPVAALNSHMPTHGMYDRMLAAYEGSDSKPELNFEDLKTVLDSRIHPENR